MEKGYSASLGSWIATLSIATRLLFDAVRERAIEEITGKIDGIDAIELILLAQKLNVDAWLAPGFARVVERNEMLTDSEAARLPFADVLLIMRCRETRNKPSFVPPSGSHCTSCNRYVSRTADAHCYSCHVTPVSVLQPALTIVKGMLASRSVHGGCNMTSRSSYLRVSHMTAEVD